MTQPLSTNPLQQVREALRDFNKANECRVNAESEAQKQRVRDQQNVSRLLQSADNEFDAAESVSKLQMQNAHSWANGQIKKVDQSVKKTRDLLEQHKVAIAIPTRAANRTPTASVPGKELELVQMRADRAASSINTGLNDLASQTIRDRKTRRVRLLASAAGVILAIVFVITTVLPAIRAAQALAHFKTSDVGAMINIPAGPFQMGCSSADTSCSNDEKPLHTVTLDAYQIDKYEVTNGQYARCVDAGKCTQPGGSRSNTRGSYYGSNEFIEYPVIYVSWVQASAFCTWDGKRLPTEAEWEKAARGAQDTRIYPWSNNDTSCSLANTSGCSAGGDTDRVGNHSQGASPYGVQDMAGNVWEWTADWYSETYYQSSPNSNPTGSSSGQGRVLRGGSWSDDSRLARVSNRDWDVPGLTDSDFGFRCAR